MIITALSNNKDNGGRTALVEYSNAGEYLQTHWMPSDQDLNGAVKTGKYSDGFGYDIRALPRRNAMFTSSFTGWSNYMMDFGKMLGDQEAMKRFGNTMVRWDLHARKPKEVFDVPVRRWKCAALGNHAITDDQGLWVNTFMDGKTRYFDMSDPFNPKQTYEKQIGAQVNMASSSWDGKRVYYTSSLLANWDKKGADNEQYFKAYNWDGKELTEQFSIDFTKEKLGRAHQMRFGAYSLYANASPVTPKTKLSQLAQ
ncbi:methanethiol oxidase-like [Oratosquilla oratoria]|uniref:methanethiol oxidase-like n=1 Tax=Oratosquilla oratoria TaxID=337810 RepID=UPI003F759D83